MGCPVRGHHGFRAGPARIASEDPHLLLIWWDQCEYSRHFRSGAGGRILRSAAGGRMLRSGAGGRMLRGRRAPLPGRSGRSSRRRLDFEVKTTLTSGPRWGVPRTSIVSTGRISFSLGVISAVTVVPSRVVSTSARRTEPTPAPSGTSEASTVPRGCLAPAARHVHVDSSVRLVSSTSMRWAIPGDRLLRHRRTG